jgi:tape measure domain-containing protein
MSTSLGRLTLDLAADPTQLNNDLNAVKAHAQQIAKDIENSLRQAFQTAGSAATNAANQANRNNNTGTSNNFFSGLNNSLTSFTTNIRTTFASLRTLNFTNIFRGLKTSFQNIPQIAQNAIRNLPRILKAGVATLPIVLAAVGIEAGKRLGQGVLSATRTGLSGLGRLAQKAGSTVASSFNAGLGAIAFGAFTSAGVSAFNTVTGVIGGAINQVKGFGGELFNTLKEVQKFDARLKTFVTDTEKRAELNKRLNSFAATTPFELKDIRESAIKNLSTMADPSKLNLDKYMADLKALGDVAAGSQQPVGELADKFAKARSEGKAQNEDLQEWAGRGIPIYQELGKLLGATAAEVRQMATDGKVDFEMLSAAVSSMTQEGGVFFKSMENQAGTLEGKISNISDTFYQFKEQLGKAFEPLANLGVDIFGEIVSSLKDSKGVMEDITKETQKLADYFKENPEIAKSLNKALQDIIRGAMKGLVNGVKSFTEFLKDNPDIIKQIATGIATVSKTIAQVVGYVVDLASTFGGAVADNIAKNQDLITGIINIIRDIVDKAIEIASVFGNTILNAVNENNFLIEGMRNIVTAILDLWYQHKDTLLLIAQSIGSLVVTALKVVIDLVLGILNYLKEHPAIIQTIVKTVQFLSAIFEGILKTIGLLLQGLGWVIEKVTQWVAANQPIQTFFDGVSTAVTGIITGMDNIIAKTFDWLKKLEPVQKALEWIGNLSNSGGDNSGNENNGEVQDIGNSMNGMLNTMGGSFDPFAGGSNSFAAKVVGHSEGNRTATGGFNASYKGHSDPGNAQHNVGSFSMQTGTHGMKSPEQADIYWQGKLKGVWNQFVQAAQKAGLDPNNPTLAANFLDLYTQSPAAAVEGMTSFINNLDKIKAGGGTEEAILKTRLAAFHNSAGRLEAWTDIGGLTADQKRRMSALQAAMPNATKGMQMSSSGGLENFPEKNTGSRRGGKTIAHPSGGLTIHDSAGGTIDKYSQLTVHHPSRGTRGRESGRNYLDIGGRLEEARIGGDVAGGVPHIKKDFVLEDKNGSLDVGMPAPTSGIVSAIYPEVGAVVIGDGKGGRKGAALHMKNIRVKVGDRVSYGQIIGTQSYTGSEAVHAHVELPLNEFPRYIADLRSGRFGSAPESSNSDDKSLGNFNERGTGSNKPSNKTTPKVSSSSGGSRVAAATSTSNVSGTSSSKSSVSSSSTTSNSSGGLVAPKVSSITVSPQAKRDLLTARQKEQEKSYKEIADEIAFSQRTGNAQQKQQRELEDTARKRQTEEVKARLQLQIAKAESPEAKKILEKNLQQFDVDTKYEDELKKLQRQREDLVKSQQNKIAAIKKAEERKNEFIEQKRKAGEEYTPADLEKFKVTPDEGAMMDFSKAIKDVDKMIASQKTLKELELQTLGISESIEERQERRAKQRERDIEQLKRQSAIEIDSLKKLESSVTDEDLKKQIQEKLSKTELQLNAKIELMPIDDQLEDLQLALSEVLAAGIKKDAPEAQEIQKQIDELNKQKAEIARKSGLDLTLLENERKQADIEREREKKAETNALTHRTKIAEIDSKITSARSDTERATLEFEKERLSLLQEQSEEQQPLLDKLADLQKDKSTLLGNGIKESSEEMKILNDSIGTVTQQLLLLQKEGKTALGTLTKESQKAIDEAKRADSSRLLEKESLLSGSDLKSSRLEQMRERDADPYKTSAFEKEIAASQEALRYRQEMLDIEERIASFRDTNAELSVTEENQLRNNARAIHEINLEKVNDNVRTLGKDLSSIGKGAVKDFFGQLVSGSMDFNSIMQNIISQIGNLAVELIQSHIFGEDGWFGKKSKKEEKSGGGFLSGLLDGSQTPSSLLGGSGAGASPLQPAFVSVVGSGGGIGGLIGGATGTSSFGGGTDFISAIFGGGGSINKTNPLPIDMVSADKNAFSGLGDIFSGIFGGGSSGGLGGMLGGLFGGATGGSTSSPGGGLFGSILGILPSIFGFADGGRVQGVKIDKLPNPSENPIAKALRAESIASGQKPILAVLHEGELVLNREQQQRAGIFDVPRFDNGGRVGNNSMSFGNTNNNNINMSFNVGEGVDNSGLDVNMIRAVVNNEIIRQQGSGGSLGRGSYSRRGR